ncbi:MAG: GNAT family N-acetyltransferase [Dehalococcoidia bacterium]
MGSSLVIRALEPRDAEACDAVLASLPYFFGDPDGVRMAHEAVRHQRGFVAEADGAVRGFITLEQHQPGSSEITWLAVQAEHRRGGIGRMLVETAVELLRGEGQSMLFVLTLGPSVPEPPSVADNYEGTREFYRRTGFVGLREFGLRDWNDAYALVLGRPLLRG